MTISFSSKRILVVGSEVGPIVQLLKERIPKVSIGAVDVLGNQETRNNADWKFSVEKQSPDTSIFRVKHRCILDLLLELTLVMLEDLEFDLLIPLSPFQTKPQYIHRLTQEVEVVAPNYKSLEQVTPAYTFLTNISSKLPELIPPSFYISDLSKEQPINFPAVFVSHHQMYQISSDKPIPSGNSSKQSGYLLPISQVHCAFFLCSIQYVRFLGLQTLSTPHEHAFFPDYLEKNAMIPFSLPSGFTYEGIISYLSQIITQLRVFGLITIYFGLSKDEIFPVSCNVLADENFNLWEKRSPKTLVPFLISLKADQLPQHPSSVFAFKLPIYSSRSIRVPPLPKDLCTQRNLPRVISHPNYPLCAISGTSFTSSSINNLFQRKRKEILEILHS